MYESDLTLEVTDENFLADIFQPRMKVENDEPEISENISDNQLRVQQGKDQAEIIAEQLYGFAPVRPDDIDSGLEALQELGFSKKQVKTCLTYRGLVLVATGKAVGDLDENRFKTFKHCGISKEEAQKIFKLGNEISKKVASRSPEVVNDLAYDIVFGGAKKVRGALKEPHLT